jgi:hypothetical protein
MEVILKIKSCLQCPYHKVVDDIDPEDFFSDDEAVVCTKLENDEIGKYYTGAYFKRQKYKVVESSISPIELLSFEYIPDFCPLK